MELFDVYVAGFDVDEQRATRGLMLAFGLDESAALRFVRGVPRLAKRRQPREAAARYARTLQATGAIVECRPSPRDLEPAAAARPSRAPMTSLPAPAPSLAPQAGPLPPMAALQIPGPPRLPSEAAAAEAPPSWIEPDPTYDNRKLTSLTPTAAVPGVADAHGEGQVDQSSTRPPPELAWPVASGSSAAPRARSENPQRLGEIHVSGFPGMPERSGITMAPRPLWRLSKLRLLAVVGVLASVAYFGSTRHWLQDERDLREATWRAAGIDFGSYDEAGHFLQRPDAVFDGLSSAKLRSLLDALARTGVRRVWVVGIVARGGQAHGSSLLLELPRDASQRETIFWQHLPQLAARPLTDTGQAFVRFDLAQAQ